MSEREVWDSALEEYKKSHPEEFMGENGEMVYLKAVFDIYLKVLEYREKTLKKESLFDD